MEKEQKKLLLVAVSVGVFLLVTITVAMIILTNKMQTQNPGFSSVPVQPGRTPIESTNNNPVQPIINNTQETNIIIDTNSENPVLIDRNDGNNLEIQIPRPTTAAVPDVPDVPAVVTVRPQTTPAPATSTTRPAPAAVQQTTTSRPASTPAVARTIIDYWIQTGAFSAKVRAEDAKDLLNSKGLASIIDNREIDGRMWYRVRLGPYTTENEANYWLTLVKEIEGFGESQVRQTVR